MRILDTLKKKESIPALLGLVAIKLVCPSLRGHFIRAGTSTTWADVRLLREHQMLAKLLGATPLLAIPEYPC